MLNRFYIRFGPTPTDDEEKNLISGTVFILCVGIAVFIIFPIFHNAISNHWFAVQALCFQVLCVFITAWLNRRGFTSIAVYLLSITMLITTTLLLITSGEGSHDIAITIYPATILIAGLLLKKRPFIILTIVTIFCISGVIIAELNGVLITKMSRHTSLENLIDAVVILVVTSLAAGYFINKLRENFKKISLHKDTQQQWAQITENAGWGIVIDSGPEQTIELMNHAFAEMHGFSVDELMHKSISNLLAPEYRERADQQLKNISKQGHHIIETMHIRKDGSRFPALVDVITITNNRDHVQYRITNVIDITDRKVSEKTIKESNDKLHATLEAIPDLLLEVDQKGVIYDYHIPKHSEIEIPGGEFSGKIVEDVLSTEAAAIIHEAIGKVTQLGWYRGGSFKLDLHDGPHWYELSISAIGDSQSPGSHFLVLVHDITKLKQMEEELQASSEKFRMIFEQAYDGISIYEQTPDGKDRRLVDCNRRYAELSGHSKEELLRIGLISLLIENHIKIITPLTNDHTHLEIPYGGSFSWIRPDKKENIIEYTSVSVDIRGKIYNIGIDRDVTQQRLIESELRDSEEKYRTLIETTGTGFVILDDEGWVCDANSEYVRLTGHESILQIIGKNVIEWTAPYDRARNASEIIRCLRQGYIRNLEIDYINKEGGYVPVEINATVLQSGSETRILSLCRDITERKLQQEALKESMEKFRLIFENAYDGICLFEESPDPEKRRLLECNERYAEQAGRNREELIKIGCTFPLMKTLTQELDRTNIESMEHGKVFRGTFSWIRPDGKDNIIEYIGVILRIRGKLYAIGIDRDVTEPRRTEVELRESEEKFRMIFENAYDGINVVEENPDPYKRELVDFNDRFAEQTGRTREELLQIKYPYQLLKPLTREIDHASIQGLEDGKSFRGTFSWIRPDGKDNIIEYVGVAMRMHGKHYTIGIDRDITSQKRAEEELRNSEARLKVILDSIQAGILILDAESHIIVDANPYALQLIGTARENVIGKPCHHNVCPADKDKCPILDFERHIDNSEHFILRFDSTSIPIIKTVVPIMLYGRQHLVEFFIDISEQKKAEEQRKNLEDQLMQAQKLESLGILAAGIAHDFNNILHIISGNINLIAEKKDNQERLLHRLEMMTKATNRGTQLVKQLLMFARKTETNLQSVSMNELITDISRLLEETFPKKIIVTNSLAKNLPPVIGDQTQLHQVLLNLCVNARDAMPAGGNLSFETKELHLNDVKAKFPRASASRYVLTTVTDTGIGIDELTLKRIFDPFFTTKELGKGTGLGLSVTFGIIESHDGFIDVQSAVNKGTTFFIYLPASEKKLDVQSLPSVEISSAPAGNETILLIEDEELIRDMFVEVLEDKGYKVITAKNGDEGVESYTAHRNDIALILSDFGLPKVSGEEVYFRIKEINPQILFLIYTGFIEPEKKAELIKSGICDIINKPLQACDVLFKIREILDTVKLSR